MLYPVLQDPLRPVVGSLFDRPVGVNIRQMLFGAGVPVNPTNRLNAGRIFRSALNRFDFGDLKLESSSTTSISNGMSLPSYWAASHSTFSRLIT